MLVACDTLKGLPYSAQVIEAAALGLGQESSGTNVGVRWI
jgi:hypothetical protein